jgi:conjugative transfer signal peptidase TraF
VKKPETHGRRLIVAAIAAILIIASSFALSSVVKLNLTASMPVGVYIVHPTKVLRRGAIVIACPPANAQRVGVRNGYLAPARGILPASRCDAGSAPLLKYAIALAGDVVELSDRGLEVDGQLVDAHKIARVDRNGRTLSYMPDGMYHLGASDVWLYSPAQYSWDSRYFGPAQIRDVLGTAVPLWTTDQSGGARMLRLHN